MNETIYPAVNDILYERYLIQSEIGRGGYSIVYKATDQKIGGHVALKVLVPPPAQSPNMFARLKREALALKELHHPNIIKGIDLHIENHRAILVMQYIDGMDLAQKVENHGVRPAAEVCVLGAKIADALHTAHSSGLIHRDVKPQNVLINNSSECFLTDFGSAQALGHSSLTVTGAIVGTLGFMAPEAFSQNRLDSRADIFSLGATLYFALTGRTPSSSQAGALPIKQDGFDPREVNPNLDPWLSTVVAKSTCADPADRFQTAESFSHALKLQSSNKSVTLSPPSKSLFCLACGEEGQTHIGVCSRCLTLQSESDAVSIFLSPIYGSRDRRLAKKRLLEIFPTQAKGRFIDETLLAIRPLLLAPQTLSKQVVKQLSVAGFSAHIVDGGFLKAVPKDMLLLSLVVMSLGFLSTHLVGIGALFPSAVVATALFYISRGIAETPLADTDIKKEIFSKNTNSILLNSFSKLKHGSARKVLARIAASAGQLVQSEERLFSSSEIEEVLRNSAEAAERVDSMDTVLGNLKLDNKGLDLLLRAERIREQSMQSLLKVLALLSEVELFKAESNPKEPSSRISAMCDEMREYARLYTAAYRELGV